MKPSVSRRFQGRTQQRGAVLYVALMLLILLSLIGVVGMHVDITGMLDQAGIKVSTFQFGDQKTDSYPTTPITDAAAARFQADIDEMGELFVATVARNRGLSPDAVRATQAATFLGQHGVAAGLADAVMSADDAMMDVIASLD